MLPLPTELYKILVGPLFGCIAVACYFGCPSQADIKVLLEESTSHTTLHVLLDWSYIGVSILLGLAILLINLVGSLRDNSFKSIFVLISLITPAVPVIFHIARLLHSNWDYNCSGCFMVSLSSQLVVSALSLSWLCGKNATEQHQKFLETATNAFTVATVGILAFSLKPALVTTGYNIGLCSDWQEPTTFTSRLFIFVGYIMQTFLLLQFHTHNRLLPTYTSIGYTFGTATFGLSLLSHSSAFNMLLFSVGVLAPLLGLIWDAIAVQKSLMGDLAASQQDVERWRAVVATLKDTNAISETAVSSKVGFLFGLAGQLRIVTQGTNVLASLLADTDVHPIQSAYISKLERSLDKLSDLVSDALLYNEIELQKTSLEVVFFRLDTLMEEILASPALCAHVEEHEVDAQYIIDPSVPLSLMGDYGRLKDLVLRLVINAINYTENGQILIRVKVEKESHDIEEVASPKASTHNDLETVMLSITVEDSGAGIAAEDLEHIFDPFALNRKVEERDIGLGLSISKQLSRLFGGSLSVRSEVAKGTVSTLVCPFRVANPLTASSEPWSIGAGSTGVFGVSWAAGKRICIIDNNRIVGAVCDMHLTPVGCEVLYFTNPYEALLELKQQNAICDVFLVDYKIPGYSGEEIFRSIRNEHNLKAIPIVLMCTLKQRKVVNLPNVLYLYKPIKKEKLLTIIHSLCTNKDRIKVDDILTSPRMVDTDLPISDRPDRPPSATPPERPPSTTPERPPSATPDRPPSTTPDRQPSGTFERPDSASPDRASSIPSPDRPASPLPDRLLHNKLATIPETETEFRAPNSQLSSSSIIPSTSPSNSTSPVVPHLRSASLPPSHFDDIQIRDSTTDLLRGVSAPPSPTPPHPTLAEGTQSAPPSTNPTPVPSPMSTTVPVPRKETILLVEDNPINAKIASAVLRRHSFDVELASNGQIALERVKKNHNLFQLILMDIHMPIMDGLQSAYLIRQFEKENSLKTIPIIALTADTTPGHRASCLEAGCNEFMSKPLDYPLLIEILKRLNPG